MLHPKKYAPYTDSLRWTEMENLKQKSKDGILECRGVVLSDISVIVIGIYTSGYYCQEFLNNFESLLHSIKNLIPKFSVYTCGDLNINLLEGKP